MLVEFRNAAGQTCEAPKDYVETITLEVDGDSIESPIFEPHQRGKNWAARLDGKNAATPDRRYLPMRGRVIDLSQVQSGNALAVGGDYVTSGGNFRPDRLWTVVVAKTEDALTLDIYATEAKAISAARKGIRSALPAMADAEVS